jgi:hypothetical protein
MQTFWRSQFDKALMAALFLAMCGLAAFFKADDKVSTFALQSAAGLLGCLLTLVTGRRPTAPDTLMDPTSTTTKTSTTVESVAQKPT